MSRFFHRSESVANPSPASPIGEVIASRARRGFVGQLAASVAGAGALGPGAAGGLASLLGLTGCASGVMTGPDPGPRFPGSSSDGRPASAAPAGAASRLGFAPVPVSHEDAVRVPDGYRAQVLIRWGDPIGDPRGQPAFRFDASNTADEQALQSGTHHDGMAFFPLPRVAFEGPAARPASDASSRHGLLATNHEYPDYGTLFPDHLADWSIGKVRKAQHALGVSVIEVRRGPAGWSVVSPSRFARRIHGDTPMRISGPAAGHPWMRTAADPQGLGVRGTFANCAHGWTPWGTYLSCEENFNFFFRGRETPTPDEARYGLSAGNDYSLWGRVDPRFDLARHPNEANRFGWVVEIDPYDPQAAPVKRTALGRKKQEGAAPAICRSGCVAFYMGDDQAFEYLYKFVTARPWNPSDRAANRDLLDEGTLYVARFDADGTGRWLELVHGRGGLTAANGFASQAEVLIRTRQAADLVGATPMDRPEWTAVDPVTGAVYVTLTGNRSRGQPGRPGADAANPRAPNPHGHLLRWFEDGGDHAATSFRWEVASLGGSDPAPARDPFTNPDGLMVDPRGVLWILTDMPADVDGARRAAYGNNQMLAMDPATGETRRFLTGPRGAEITGVCVTPDSRTMFVNIQHPGEAGDAGVDPRDPRRVSNWPDFRADGRPRSATVAIRRIDGGVIGA